MQQFVSNADDITTYHALKKKYEDSLARVERSKKRYEEGGSDIHSDEYEEWQTSIKIRDITENAYKGILRRLNISYVDAGVITPEQNQERLEMMAVIEASGQNPVVTLNSKVEVEVTDTNQIESLEQKISDEIKNIINLRGAAKIVPIKSLPNDGKVIDDIRDFGE